MPDEQRPVVRRWSHVSEQGSEVVSAVIPNWAIKEQRSLHDYTLRLEQQLELLKYKVCAALCDRDYSFKSDRPQITHCRLCEEIRNG